VREGGGGMREGEVEGGTMYTHVSKCKNNKIKEKTKKIKLLKLCNKKRNPYGITTYYRPSFLLQQMIKKKIDLMYPMVDIVLSKGTMSICKNINDTCILMPTR
jgi:hypothetical protein